MSDLLSNIPLGMTISVSLLAVFAYLLYQHLTRNFDFWKKQGVVFDKPYPILGSMKSQLLVQLHLTQYFQKLYDQHQGEPYVGYFQSSTPALLALDPEFIKNVMVKDFSHFVNRGILNIHEDADPLQARNLFLLKDQKWREVRHRVLPTFTSGKIKAMFPLMQECTEQFDEHLGSLADKDEHFEAKDLLGCLFTDIIGSCIFGINTNTIKDPNNQFRVMGKRLVDVRWYQAIKGLLIVFLPELATRLKIGIMDKDVNEFFRNLVKDMMEARKKSNVIRKDFIQLLLELKEKGSVAMEVDEEDVFFKKEIQEGGENTNNTFTLSDDDLVAQATVFFFAGFETSSTLLSCTMLELAVNPDVQRKVQMELDEALAQNDGVVTYANLKHMKILDAVLEESMRKYPPVPVHLRECNKDYKIPGTDVIIEKGVIVTIPHMSLQNDPKYFEDPERFNPSRFSKDDDTLKKWIYTPFGEGPRMCIGKRFAMVQSKLALLMILRNYTVVQCSKTVFPIKLNKKQFFITAQDGIWLKLERRTTSENN